MAIEQGACASFLLELHQGIHDMTSDVFKAALYDATAELSPDTTVYTTAGEASGTGYTAGGATISFIDATPKLVARRVVLNTDPITWTGTFSFRGVLLYNATKANRAWAVIDVGRTISLADTQFVLPPMLSDGVTSLYRALSVGS